MYWCLSAVVLLTSFINPLSHKGKLLQQEPIITAAAERTEVYSTVIVPEDSVYFGQLTVTGDAVISGEVDGSVVLSEGLLTVNGKVEYDAVVMGCCYVISGEVGRDMIILGSEGLISGTIQGDAIMVGGILQLDSTAVIEGNLIMVGGELIRDSEAVIKGELQTIGLGFVGKALGDLFARKGIARGLPPGQSLASRLAILVAILRLIIILVVFGLGMLLQWALGRWHRQGEMIMERAIWKAVLTGVIYRVAVAGILLILAVSIVGLVLLPIGLLIWVFVALVAVSQASLWLGGKLARLFRIRTRSRIVLYCLGFGVIYLFSILSGVLVMCGAWSSLATRILRGVGFIIVYAAMTIGRGGVVYNLLFRRDVRRMQREQRLEQEMDEQEMDET